MQKSIHNNNKNINKSFISHYLKFPCKFIARRHKIPSLCKILYKLKSIIFIVTTYKLTIPTIKWARQWRLLVARSSKAVLRLLRRAILGDALLRTQNHVRRTSTSLHQAFSKTKKEAENASGQTLWSTASNTQQKAKTTNSVAPILHALLFPRG